MTPEETFQKIRRLISLESTRHNEAWGNKFCFNRLRKRTISSLCPGDSGDEVDCQDGSAAFIITASQSIMEGNVSLSLMNSWHTHPAGGIPRQFLSKLLWNFMRNFFSGRTARTIHTLPLDFLTGILRVAKERYLQRHLTILKTYSILDDGYSSGSGFTEKR